MTTETSGSGRRGRLPYWEWAADDEDLFVRRAAMSSDATHPTLEIATTVTIRGNCLRDASKGGNQDQKRNFPKFHGKA